MKIFVTGGNGFVGSRVVRALHAQGHRVRCLLRPTSKTHRIDRVPFERHEGDVLDPASLRSGMAGCDGVIHLASLSSWDQIRSPKMREVVLGGTTNVLEAARDQKVPRTVFVSSSTAVNGSRRPKVFDETSPFELDGKKLLYAGAKHEAEALCSRFAQEGLAVVTVNPVEVYGAEDDDLITASYIRDTLKDWPAMAVSGGTSVVHVEDVAQGILAALVKGRPGERYILGGENLTVRAIIELTLEVAGVKKWVLQLPNWLIKAVVKTLAFLHLPTPVLPDLLDYATLYWWMDSSKSQRELGYRFRTAREAVADVVRWLKETQRV